MRTSHVSFRAISFYVLTLGLMVLLFGLSIRLGTYTLSFEEIWAAFKPDDKNYFTLMEYRLPRAVLAILLGGALAISGVLVQSVVRNPLASPDILGINNAAGLIAVSVLMFLPNLAFYWMPIFAFLGGVLSFVILWIVCGFNFRPIKMAIIGVALSALWAAISHYLMLTNPVEINTAMLWLTGSLWGRSWSYLNVVLPWLVVLLPLPFIFCRDLDTLGLGENKASTLGVTVNKVQISVLVLAVALSTTAVAICGPIAFLGLVAPHLARRLVGGRHRTLLPAALIIGALLLQLSDILARVIDPPTELPAGILTAIIGAPYFFYLLMRTK
ncbi:MAG: Fe(3+) dicitrate ABC transporter permease subunit FecD [Haemophilus haemolyticus]|jgi:kpLE2 phage-like element; iron-dicitrate transporter subunit (fecd. fecd)|uniref:Fe(3+) dicitrate ABC transporter permease subunit FecD n=1 Tax=Haemophilus haemolyticus TaxID=726 RepID=A0A0M3FZ07_HAEHA|nr:Fe(3+) dicitrate ABC transporter permease subunit FecD [Haemophilus haemolyticus]EGT78225.1 ironIII ABC superfamily ATP binding cassette transporter, membrane protein [Haemophilus haemolyticus M21127]KKZ53843.1 iron-dicitrate transporter subunit FecD [Haemophilus haemolyticus]MDU7464033.1 Fe(3+) dicitrate ABC transporter permease subunit FecD [Haemophilus haemolyticus]TDN40887.1 Iron(III) dicitrate transport system permease protein FecD [Haemophilus haemolyticus]TPG98709.1 Fe(3+) dicitrate 